MKTHIILILAVAAGLQSVSAEDFEEYLPVEVPLPFKTSWFSGIVRDGFSFPSPRIVGGSEVTPNSHPHQVALLMKLKSPDGKVSGGFCGGSLISDSWIITAGHCVDKRVLSRDISGDIDKYELNVTAMLGAHNYTDKTAPGIQLINASQIIINPVWNLFELANDIALLKLEHIASLDGKYVKTIRLPKESQKSESFYNSEVTMTGWGVTQRTNKMPSEVLRSVDSKVVGNFYCSFRYLFLLVRESNICASGWGWKGTCYGDSGGPMIVKEADGERTLVGITSFGIGCSWGFPSVFTRVSSYLDWIHTTTGITQRH